MKEEVPKAAEEAPKQEVAPPPTPSPEPPAIEIADGDINDVVDPEERDPDGAWAIVKKAGRLNTTEGENVSITVVVAKGDPLHPPRVQWIKGKWNEITAGARYAIDATENAYTLTFKSPKMTDSGVYTVKVHSASGAVDAKTFDLKVGPELGANPGIVIVRGKLP